MNVDKQEDERKKLRVVAYVAIIINKDSQLSTKVSIFSSSSVLDKISISCVMTMTMVRAKVIL